MIRTLFPYALLIILPTLTLAQAPDIEWENTLGGILKETATSAIQTDDGGFLVVGHSFSPLSADKSEPPLGENDMWIIKFDSAGTTEWDETIGGNDQDGVLSVAQTLDGGYALFGWSYSSISGDKTENPLSLDSWIVKIDSDRNILWQHSLGGPDWEFARDMLQLEDGTLVLLHSSWSSYGGDKTTPNYGGEDYWLVWLNSDGDIIRQSSYGSELGDVAQCLVAVPDGGFLLGGYSNVGISGTKTSYGYGDRDFWLVRTDSIGTQLWDLTYGGDMYDGMTDIIATNDGQYYLIGSSNSAPSGNKTTDTLGMDDVWVLKVDDNGNILWQASYGGLEDDNYPQACLLDDEGIAITVVSESGISGNKNSMNYGAGDIWLLRLNSEGDIDWQKGFSGEEIDVGNPLLLQDGGLLLSGYSRSGVSVDKSEPNIGEEDWWLIKLEPEVVDDPCAQDIEGLYADYLSSTTAKLHWDSDPNAIKYQVRYGSIAGGWINTISSTNVKNLFSLTPNTEYMFRVRALCGPGLKSPWSSPYLFSTPPLRMGEFDSNVSIFPNPTQGDLTIQVSEEILPAKLHVFDMLGREVLPLQELTDASTQLSLIHVPPGTYLLTITGTAGNKSIHHFIVE